MSAGNEAQSWHGTNRECLLGERDRSRFCISSSCSLCCVIKSSFDIGFVKTNVARWGVILSFSDFSTFSHIIEYISLFLLILLFRSMNPTTQIRQRNLYVPQRIKVGICEVILICIIFNGISSSLGHLAIRGISDQLQPRN